MASDTPDKPTEAAAPATADQKQDVKATALGEDDEFEDFPVDGTPLPPRNSCWRAYLLTTEARIQTGRKTKQRPQPSKLMARVMTLPNICGKNLGTTMTRVMISHSSSSAFPS